MDLLTNKYFIIGAVLVALLLYIRILRADLEVCQTNRAVLTESLKISKKSVEDLQTALNKQNLEIEKFKNEADEREKKYIAEIDRAKRETELAKKKSKDLISRVIPQGKTACDAADELFNEEIQNAK